jgi:hypothetical protein
MREAVMWLGKLLSVGEVAERAPIEEPAMARPEPGPVTTNDEQSEVLGVAPTAR